MRGQDHWLPRRRVFVPIGGAGGCALGGWVLHHHGLSIREIARRFVVLFVLTSAVHVSALIPAGLPRATAGLADPRDPLLILAPAAVGILVLVCATPRRPGTARISGPIRSLSTAAKRDPTAQPPLMR